MEPQAEYWNIDAASAALLQALILAQKPKKILEIGTSNGYSAIQMGKVAVQHGGTITTIEFFEERAELAKKNIEKEGLSETITILRGDALEILASFPQTPSYDFIFLDANKEEYAQYFENAMKLISPNGIIIADNTISHAKKLSAFFTAVQNETRAQARELSVGTGLLLITVYP